MPKKKKPFINKKAAQTFSLVQREVEEPTRENSTEEDRRAEVLDEQHKFGIYYADGYDYLQHLRDSTQKRELGIREDVNKAKPKVIIPGTELAAPEPPAATAQELFARGLDDGMFASLPELEAEVEVDPEVTCALEEGVAGGDLEDDFMELARADDRDYVVMDEEYSGDDEMDDLDVEADGEQHPDLDGADVSKADMLNWLRGVGAKVDDAGSDEDSEDDEKPPHLVQTRSKLPKTADERFDELLKEYASDEESCSSTEGVDFESETMVAYMKQAKELVDNGCLRELVEPGRQHVRPCDVHGSDQDEYEYVMPEAKQRPKYDAVSIISTYSNTQNLPTMIEVPKDAKKIALSSKTGLPLGVLPQPGPTRRQQEALEHALEAVRLAPASGSRPEGETPEERRLRKAAVKEDRRYRRMEKKQTKVAFKAEKIRQDRAQAGQQVQANVKL